MNFIKVCFILIFSTGQISQFGQEYKRKESSISLDTIKYLKKRSENLIIEKKYEEVYHIFSYIANFYFEKSNLRMFFDYKNKASNCLSKYSEQGIALDSTFQLIKQYNETKLNDTVLIGSIIKNFVDNYTNKQYYAVKLEYLDYLLDSIQCKIPATSKILLAKNRIEITNRLSIPGEQFNSYYSLLKLGLPPKEEIKFEIDLGNLYHELKEYQLSNITLLKTLCNENLSESDKAIIYNIIGSNYLHLNKYSLSYNFYNLSLSIRNNLQNNADYLRVIYNNLANYQTNIGKMDSAKVLYTKSLEISKKAIGYNSRETAFQFNNLGNHYFNLERYDSAFIFYQESFNIKESISNYNDIDIIHSLYNLGRTQSKLGNTSKAILLLQKSIIKNFELANIYSLKNGLLSPDDYMIACDILGETYYKLYKQYHNKSFLDSAKIYYNKVITTNDSIIYSTPIESSKILFNHSRNKSLENYLHCFVEVNSEGCYPITDTSQVLSLFDKSHNYVLLNKLLETDTNLHNSLITSFNKNDKSIDETNNALELLENDPLTNLRELFELSSFLFEKMKWSEHSSKKNKLQYNWKNEQIIATGIKEIIDSQTIILEYNTIDGFLYCLSITNNSIYLNKIGEIKELRNLINECNNKLRKFSIDFNQLFDLSNILLAPIKNISSLIKKIIIIKDEKLLTIPFDALLLSKPENDSKNNSYLINDYDISYSYSINLNLRKSSQVTRNDNFDFIGFTPTDFHCDKQNPADQLNSSIGEISDISRLFENSNLNSLTLFGKEANIENFYNFAGKTKILHIATHSSINNNSLQTELILNSSNDNNSDNLITYFDILNLPNSPELVILASCSSNSGKLFEGEGIQNIGRAFAIKGASFIISSLFRLDDEFSYKFMSVFYNKLLATKNIKKSFCESKREFIRDIKYYYPTYWSNFNIIEK